MENYRWVSISTLPRTLLMCWIRRIWSEPSWPRALGGVGGAPRLTRPRHVIAGDGSGQTKESKGTRTSRAAYGCKESD